jgi:hypothetical protein
MLGRECGTHNSINIEPIMSNIEPINIEPECWENNGVSYRLLCCECSGWPLF